MAYRYLRTNDPFTFCEGETIMHESGRECEPGDNISKWFRTDEPGRVFKIVKVHKFDHGRAYECTFLGFMFFDPVEGSDAKTARLVTTDDPETHKYIGEDE